MQAYFVAAELLRIPRAIVPLVVVQNAIKYDGVYPGKIFKAFVSAPYMRPYYGGFLRIKAARG